MSSRIKLVVTLIAGVSLLPAAPPASAKAKHHKQTHAIQPHSKRYNSYLVPPPPAYMPSILPELQTAENPDPVDPVEPEKPANPYKKYVYTREGHEDPAPKQPNKYVTYWNNKG
jgi:hypothetical protein